MNNNDLLREEISIDADPVDGTFDERIKLDTQGAWDQDGNPGNGAELKIELYYPDGCLLGSGSSTMITTPPVNEADSEDPDISKDVNIPSSVSTGETFSVNVLGSNFGGHPGEFNAVQIEFPRLTSDSDGQYIESPTGSSGSHIRIAPDDELSKKGGGTTDAEYWQTELAFGPDELYLDGANTGQLETTVTAPPVDEDGDGVNDPYTFVIRTRATFTDDTDQTQYFHSPRTDTTDDQGHAVERHEISVSGPDECPDDAGDNDGYRDNGCPENPAPSVSLSGGSTSEGGETVLSATGSDPEDEPLRYDWNLNGPGSLSGSGSTVTYEAPRRRMVLHQIRA